MPRFITRWWRNYTTKHWETWWANRKIDWDVQYLQTWNHPHRDVISAALGTFNWTSLLEIGCGSGANLANIVRKHKNKQLGGVDVNPEAIELARKTFTGGLFKVSPADDVFFSDDAADVVLTDMCLIYIGPRKIDKVIGEIKRLARNRIVLSEFHMQNWYDRLHLRIFSGQHGYDYRKLLEKHGFYDIEIYKYPPELWPNNDHAKQGRIHLIVARVPRRKTY